MTLYGNDTHAAANHTATASLDTARPDDKRDGEAVMLELTEHPFAGAVDEQENRIDRLEQENDGLRESLAAARQEAREAVQWQHDTEAERDRYRKALAEIDAITAVHSSALAMHISKIARAALDPEAR